MSAELLREAAALMRERAEAATAGRWVPFGTSIGAEVPDCTCHGGIAPYGHEQYCGVEGPVVQGCEADMEHVAGIATPAVALAMADWLDTAGADIWAHGPLCICGTGCDACDDNLWEPHARDALAVARAYLGRDA